MRKYLLIPFLLLLVCTGFAQTKPKQKEKENPPAQEEMQDMMKEMQEAMDDMSAEDKRAMDSMGIKMPDIKAIKKNVSGINDAQLKNAYENENRIVPQKDAARINIALSVTLSNAEMNAYVNRTQQAVILQLSPAAKAKGAEIYQQISKLKASVANTAVGLWMDGQPTLALYLMGEACKTDPANAINLNNYAAFLTMCGAQQLALSILNNLNKRYPKNSSILNNIAQANMAKCLIEESKGNIPAAMQQQKKVSVRHTVLT